MTYAELGYLRALYDALHHECAEKPEREQLSELFAEACGRFKLDAETADLICEALEGKE